MSQDDRKKQSIEVPASDPDENLTPEEKEKRDREKDKDKMQELHRKESQFVETDAKKNEKDDDELSLEDQKLKELLEELVEKITDKTLTEELRKNALEALRAEIRQSTTSMTSVPKPLKFLRPHYDTLKTFYDGMAAHSNKIFMADVLSVLAMTMAKENTRESLTYKLLGNRRDLGDWGHEYVRHLAGEIGEEYNDRVEKEKPYEDLVELVRDIIPFDMTHNAETDAVDLLIEVDLLDIISPYINADNSKRVCSYIAACAEYAPDSEEKDKMMRIVYNGYLNSKDFVNAARIALKLNDKELIVKTLETTKDDRVMMKQVCFVLGASRFITEEYENDDDLMAILGNRTLNQYYKVLAKELDVLAPKSPEDIYKSHLTEGARGGAKLDNAKQNLASSFVTAFVNAGFGTDTLITTENSDWIYKNKEHNMLSATAALGMIMLWDTDNGFSALDKYSFSAQSFIKAGSLLGTGIMCSGVKSEMDAALGLLGEHLESKDANMKTAAIMGLAFAYAGSNSQDVREQLVPLLVDGSQSMEVVSLTALALGMVHVGSADDEISGTIIEMFMDRSETDLKDSSAKLMCLGLGLLFLNRGEACEAALLAVSAIEKPISAFLKHTIEVCAYFGTGNVLQIQKLLSVCGEHIEDENKNAHQSVAVLGIAGLAIAEPLGEQMVLRSFDHLLQYGEINIRRAVPLALALLSVSNPQLPVMDTLSKLSHDSDEFVSQNAILALGFIGAGTNNSRIANLLRTLAGYYSKEANHLFLIRIAQGLLHMGKGLVTLRPYHSDHLLLSNIAAAGLLTVLFASLDMNNNLLGKRHYLLYSLVLGARPRSLITVDEELKFVPVKVRVGQGIDTVGVAGRPKTITGFQSHTTPVLIAHGERAELASDEYIALSPVLEGVVIVRKNPDAQPEEQ